MHILQAGLHSHEINSKKIKSLILNISHTRTSCITFFILYLKYNHCKLYDQTNEHFLCINLMITRNELKSRYPKPA